MPYALPCRALLFRIYGCPRPRQELDCTNNRINSVTPPPSLPALRVLSLRQNAISSLPPLPYPALTHLDLYLNALTTVTAAAFPDAKALEVLDLSFNSIKSLSSFPDTTVLPALRELYLIRNKVSRVRGLRLAALQLLELGDNRLRVCLVALFVSFSLACGICAAPRCSFSSCGVCCYAWTCTDPHCFFFSCFRSASESLVHSSLRLRCLV